MNPTEDSRPLFPFVDGVQVLAEAGIRAVLTSSGSVNDDAVQQYCLTHNVQLFMVPDAIGRGFFGH